MDGCHGGEAVHKALLVSLGALYQKVLCSGNLPEAWHAARIPYLHKKGSKTGVSNYRPISLISVQPGKASYILRLSPSHGLVASRGQHLIT